MTRYTDTYQQYSAFKFANLGKNMLYKYRDFKTEFWKNIFQGNRIWFATRAILDDPSEFTVAPEQRELMKPNIEILERRTVVLSLGSTPTNDDLWARYADDGRGFCIELDLTNFEQMHSDMSEKKVDYVENGTATFQSQDYHLIKTDKLAEAVSSFQKRMFWEKSKDPWEPQQETRFLRFMPETFSQNGVELELPENSIKCVFVKKSRIDNKDLKDLTGQVDLYYKKFKSEVKITYLD